MKLSRVVWRGLLPGVVACLGCGDGSMMHVTTTTGTPPNQQTGVGGAGSMHGGTGGAEAGNGGAGRGGAAGMGGAANPLACPDIFDQGTLATYDIDFTPDQWAAISAEFTNLAELQANPNFATYHPLTFHLNNETVTNAEAKLHGQSSWEQTVMLDGAKAKMQ
ncbi:MAG TPA: hypothetical protein VGP64_03075, partial [Polyangia bacterium]